MWAGYISASVPRARGRRLARCALLATASLPPSSIHRVNDAVGPSPRRRGAAPHGPGSHRGRCAASAPFCFGSRYTRKKERWRWRGRGGGHQPPGASSARPVSLEVAPRARCAAPSCARAPSRSRRGLSVFEGTPRRAFRDRGCASDTHGGLSVVPLAGQACTHGDFTHVDPDDANICWTTADAAAAGAATEDSCGQWCTLSKTHGSGCSGAAANLCSSCRQITCPEGRVLDDGSYDDYLAEPSELVCCTPGTGRA